MDCYHLIHGALYGLFPIGWIVLAAVVLYQITVRTGQFDVIKQSVASLTEDRRIQALLIAFSFGAFLEGCAGFGAPVAISAGMLVGLGFDPRYAAGLCLVANTAPVAFGSIGIPLITASQVTGLDLHALSQMVGRQLPLLSLIVPFYLVALMAGWRGIRAVWPAALVSGGSFAAAQFLTSNLLGQHGPGDVTAGAEVIDVAGVPRLTGQDRHPAAPAHGSAGRDQRGQRAPRRRLSPRVVVAAHRGTGHPRSTTTPQSYLPCRDHFSHRYLTRRGGIPRDCPAYLGLSPPCTSAHRAASS